MKFPKKPFKLMDHNGNIHLAEYIGRQQDFECCVCGNGSNCHTFNVFSSEEAYKNGEYETIAYGPTHISLVRVIA